MTLTTVLLLGLGLPAQDAEQRSYFFYLSDKRVIALEVVNEKKAILNYINLSDSFELIEAPNLLLVDTDGESKPGHLILNEDADSDGSPYLVSDLIQPGKFRGWDILGDFRLGAELRSAYLRLGSRVVELELLSSEDFDLVATKIGEIDLTQQNSKMALVDAGFWRGYGVLHQADSETAETVKAQLPTDPIAPRLLAQPRPRLTGEFLKLPDPVVVRLEVRITALGGILDPRVVDGVQPELDKQAIDTVRNSWEFLPAIADGKTVDSELVLRVVFGRE